MRIPFTSRYVDNANLRLRVISAAILIPLVLGAVILGNLAFGVLLTCVVVLGLYEWLTLVGTPSMRIKASAYAMLIVTMTVGELVSVPWGLLWGAFVTLALFFLAIFEHQKHPGLIAFGLPYMGGCGLALLALRHIPYCGTFLVVYLLMIVWGTDIGAYVAGRLIGGPKLAPLISPNKTWAGLLGGMALALFLGYLTALFLGARHPLGALILSPVCAVVSQCGDLFESYFKRRSGLKESGHLIPGHGGILDRIDGLVFAAIFMALFQDALGSAIGWW